MIDGRRKAEGSDAVGPDVVAASSAAESEVVERRPGLGTRLVRLGVSADLVTAIGVVLSAVNAVVIGLGDLYVACGLLIVGGLMDTLDGVVAKAAGTSSKRGAFFDSVADRISDSLLFAGLAYYLAAGHHPREALLPVAILAVGSVISYERAKAESLGFDAKGGLMERAERLIGFGLAMLFHIVMVEILWALLALTMATAVGRFVRVWRQASVSAPVRPAAVAGPWRRGKVESRWRPLRETGTATPARLALAPGARWRNRRRTATLSTRLRRVLSTQEAGRTARVRSQRRSTAGQARAARGQARAARVQRRRVDNGRSH